MKILEALAQLDTLDDDQWTQDGAPKVDVVSELVGMIVTRSEIISAAPKFTRDNPVTDLEPEQNQEPPVQEPDASVDTSVIESFLGKEPILPEHFAQEVLSKLPSTDQLPLVENMLIDQLSQIEVRQRELDEFHRRVKMDLALTRTWIKKLIPDMSNQQAIQAYIAHSNQQRAAKAQQIKEALGGLKPADIAKLDPRAAIDRAFSRKTGRGGARPVR